MLSEYQFKKSLVQFILRPLKASVNNHHGRIVLLGLIAGIAYFPFWAGRLFSRLFMGKVDSFIIMGLFCFAGIELWNKRQIFSKLVASEEDRFLGHIWIIVGVGLFPFCRFALWPQSLLCLLILLGIIVSTWGFKLFSKVFAPLFAIGLTFYPPLSEVFRATWEFVTPHLFLEKIMASASSYALNLIGFTAMHENSHIILPEGAVKVIWGCNGLSMAIQVAAAGLFMGWIYRQSKIQLAWLVTSATLLALVFNVPRLMLLAIANVYWGEWWFEFWHGFWGGQVFATILLTIYYYVAMALIKRQSDKIVPKSSVE